MTEGANTELWKSVPGYEGLYEVSNLGQVKRIAKSNRWGGNRLLTPFPNHLGYTQVSLNKNGKTYHARVHRLVLSAFVGDPPTKLDANHINGIRDDNRLVNLEWITTGDNIRHSYRHNGRQPKRGETNTQAKLTDDAVRDIRKLNAAGTSYTTLAKRYGVSRGAIAHVVTKKSWIHVTQED